MIWAGDPQNQRYHVGQMWIRDLLPSLWIRYLNMTREITLCQDTFDRSSVVV
jgi:hypothetical protein